MPEIKTRGFMEKRAAAGDRSVSQRMRAGSRVRATGTQRMPGMLVREVRGSAKVPGYAHGQREEQDPAQDSESYASGRVQTAARRSAAAVRTGTKQARDPMLKRFLSGGPAFQTSGNSAYSLAGAKYR